MIPRATRSWPRRQGHLDGHARGDAGAAERRCTGAQAAAAQVTIIGGGDVGFRLARAARCVARRVVRIIERDKRAARCSRPRSRTLVLNGDGTDLEFLEAENVGRSDVLVSA